MGIPGRCRRTNYGVRGQFAIGDARIFVFADFLVDEKNSSVVGKADYFEQFAVLGPLPSCCGSQGGFEVNAYFGRPSALSCTLFGLGLIAVSFDSQLFESFPPTVDAEFPMASSD